MVRDLLRLLAKRILRDDAGPARQTNSNNTANNATTNASDYSRTVRELSERLDSLQQQIRELKREPERVRQEAIRVSYTEYGNQIRHFSTVRSALTTFLLTVSMTAFSAYFTPDKSHPFLMWVGGLFLFGAVVECLAFSYRTERELLRYRYMWQFLTGKRTMASADEFNYRPRAAQIIPHMLRDPMNILMLPAVALVIILIRHYALRP